MTNKYLTKISGITYGVTPQYDTHLSIEQRVKKVISMVLLKSVSEIKNSSNFIRDLGADHWDGVEWFDAIEEEFNIEIPDEEAEKFHTVQDLITYLKGRVND